MIYFIDAFIANFIWRDNFNESYLQFISSQTRFHLLNTKLSSTVGAYPVDSIYLTSFNSLLILKCINYSNDYLYIVLDILKFQLHIVSTYHLVQ